MIPAGVMDGTFLMILSNPEVLRFIAPYITARTRRAAEMSRMSLIFHWKCVLDHLENQDLGVLFTKWHCLAKILKGCLKGRIRKMSTISRLNDG
mmetsp:Transcript_43374/g.126334  ORF Transcript_43374/g.126334 Transcript_43374/m.126334 type:complete len:94 (-) Transcript_43374:344-625(-)